MRTDLVGTIGLSAISGARSALGPALVVAGRPRLGGWRSLVYAMAAAELIGDKLPRTPNRTSTGPLLVRFASGAWVAATRSRGGQSAKARAALLGAAAAVGSASASYHLRRALSRWIGGGAIANVAAGLIEDAAVLIIGARFATRG